MTTRHLLVANVFFAPFTYGGATIVAEEVAKVLTRRAFDGINYRVTAVSLCTRAELKDYTVLKSERDGIQNYIINVPPGRSYAQIYDNEIVKQIMGDLMDDLRPDALHAHCVQDMGTGVLQAAKDRNIPIVLSVHDFWWLCERQFMIQPDQKYCGQFPVQIENCRSCVADIGAARVRFEHLQAISTLPDRVTYPSQFAHDLSVASGFAPGTGVVWENGVKLPNADFGARQAARRVDDSRLTFGFVGGPSAIKGWPMIRDAFKRVERGDFRVIVVEGSPDGSWWRGNTFHGLSGDWEVHPRFGQGNIDDFYAQIDVLLFMSQWKETFGLTIREALARGIGVIQTDSGGTTEHGAIPANDLIPLGAPVDVLRDQINAVLAAHPVQRAAWPVADYDDQAAALNAILNDIVTA